MRTLGESEMLSFFLGVAVGAGTMYAARTVRVERHPLSGGRGLIREVTMSPRPEDVYSEINAEIDTRNEPRRLPTLGGATKDAP